MTWKVGDVHSLFDLIDFAGGVTLYQRVNVSGLVWVNGTSRAIAGGIGVVQVCYSD
ncbi:hypothetical protein BDM02DRAFT_3118002, partial [Thelephora ganbajun]